jgi:hypothetical protein
VSYTAADGTGSGIDAAASDAKPFVFTGEGAGQSHSFTVYDLTGNSATGTVSGIAIDKTVPVVTLTPARAVDRERPAAVNR